MLPTFALFLPVAIAVAATAVVHLSNNLFKLFLTYKYINYRVLFRFGGPALIASFAGASTLIYVTNEQVFLNFFIGNLEVETSLVKLLIGLLIVIFAGFELFTSFKKLSFNEKWIPVGGILSGFFGGVSGNQGALRSAFLIKLGLPKDSFIGTGVAIAVVVDIARLIIYAASFFSIQALQQENATVYVLIAIFGATFGALLGKRILRTVTIRSIQILVSGLLMLSGLLLIFGLI